MHVGSRSSFVQRELSANLTEGLTPLPPLRGPPLTSGEALVRCSTADYALHRMVYRSASLKSRISYVLQDMICYAIVPMNVGCAIYDKPVIFGKLFAPRFLISVNSPIITIISAPQNRLSLFVQELLGNHTAVIGFNIHYAHGVITFASNGNGISANNIKEEIFVHARNRVSNSLNITFNGQIRFRNYLLQIPSSA